MKYLRRNQQDNLPLRPLQESLDEVQQVRFGRQVGLSKIGAGLGGLNKGQNLIQN